MFEGNSEERSGGRNDEPAIYALDVIRVWRSILAYESPWNTMSLDDIDGCMHRVLIELLDEERSPDRDARVSRLRAVAHEHGTFRCHQQCNEPESEVRVRCFALCASDLPRPHSTISTEQAGYTRCPEF